MVLGMRCRTGPLDYGKDSRVVREHMHTKQESALRACWIGSSNPAAVIRQCSPSSSRRAVISLTLSSDARCACPCRLSISIGIPDCASWKRSRDVAASLAEHVGKVDKRESASRVVLLISTTVRNQYVRNIEKAWLRCCSLYEGVEPWYLG